jgi:Uma2 family endonuclease
MTAVTPATPPLQSGDRLSAEEFERRYDAMPHLKKAELINGVVYVASPVSFGDHAGPHFDLIGWLGLYRIFTPDVCGGGHGTLRLDLNGRPQPDAFLFIPPGRGGQARIDEDDYIVGAPELVAEVAASSVSYDLHDKFDAYRSAGVREYVVWRVYDREIDWFVLRDGQFVRLALAANGLYHSEVFPGLWLDPAALMRGDLAALLQIAQQGAQSPEHGEFVRRLRRTTP